MFSYQNILRQNTGFEEQHSQRRFLICLLKVTELVWGFTVALRLIRAINTYDFLAITKCLACGRAVQTKQIPLGLCGLRGQLSEWDEKSFN